MQRRRGISRLRLHGRTCRVLGSVLAAFGVMLWSFSAIYVSTLTGALLGVIFGGLFTAIGAVLIATAL